MPLTITRNDITLMNVDAIINAANANLQVGGGVCGAIFNAAGADKLQKACDNLAPIQTGEAVITKGFLLPAKYIIHTAGPVYCDGNHNEEILLRLCYKNSLDLAKKYKCRSIAFPLISSGSYGYPKDDAIYVATNTIGEWLINNDMDMDVSLVVFDKAAFALSKKLLGEVKAFIDENYADEHGTKYSRSKIIIEQEAIEFNKLETPTKMPDCLLQTPQTSAAFDKKTKKQTQRDFLPLDKFDIHLDEPFPVTLLRLIDEKGKTDVEVYKRANLDRKLFSKIRTSKGYMPSKKTVIALAISLELSLTETRDLLEKAGFALSRSVMFDVIIEYFITQKKYNIFEINNVLFEYDQPILGG